MTVCVVEVAHCVLKLWLTYILSYTFTYQIITLFAVSILLDVYLLVWVHLLP